MTDLWNRCDECGRFVKLDDIAAGKATRRLATPDSAATAEVWETLCRDHSPRAADSANVCECSDEAARVCVEHDCGPSYCRMRTVSAAVVHSHQGQTPVVVATLCPTCFQDIPPGHPDHPDSAPACRTWTDHTWSEYSDNFGGIWRECSKCGTPEGNLIRKEQP